MEGQVAVQNSPDRIRGIELVPPDAPVAAGGRRTPSAAADQIVLAPGSLFTSLLPALAAADVHAALAATDAPVVAVVNLGPQPPETLGLDVADHVRAVLDAGVRVDRVVVDPRSRAAAGPGALAALGVECTMAEVARPDVAAHAPAKLASVLSALLQS